MPALIIRAALPFARATARAGRDALAGAVLPPSRNSFSRSRVNVSSEKLLLAFSGRPVVHGGAAPRPLQFKYRKTVALLGYLASQPRREVRREQLADLLWPGLDMPAGRANLRVVLADLLAQWRLLGLPEAIQVHREWIAFQPVAGLGTDAELLAPQRPRDMPSAGPLAAWVDLLPSEPDAWLAGAEEGTSEAFVAWLDAQRLRMDAARAAWAAEASPPAAPQEIEPIPSVPLPATETAAITLLRVQLPDVAASDRQPSAPALSSLMAALAFTAQRFDGVVLDVDDAGCTLGFGIDSRHTGQRWQALRCAAGLAAAMPAGQQLSAGATHGWLLVERTPAPRAVGWRMRLVERLAQRAEPGELVCDESMADVAPGFGCLPLGPQRFRGLGREFTLFGCRLDEAVTTLPPGGDFAGSSFFGREALVQSILADLRAPAGGGIHRYCLAGEAGVGKTRTAWECARRWQAQGAPLVWMSGLPEGAAVPWRSLHDLVAGLLGGGAGAADRLARIAGAELPTPAREALLAFLDTRNVGRRQRADLAEGLLHLLHGRGSQPALFVVDDVQWLDPATTEFLLPLAASASQAPLRWLLTHRSGEAQPLPLGGLRTLALAPLDDAAAQAIVQSLPDAATLTPQALRSRIANARGLPLYLLAGSLQPDSASHFNEFCRALLNRMGPLREGMEAAAVLGMLFSLDDLAHICGQELAERAFARALETGLILSRGRGQAAFFHARLREHLLSITPAELLRQHARAAAARTAGQGLHARAAALWEQGGQPDAAAAAWLQAARHAFAEDDICAACDSYARLAALGYLPGVAGIEARILHARALIARHGYGSGEAHALVVELGRMALPPMLDPVIRFDLQMLAYLGSSSQGEADGLDYARRLEASAHSPVQRFAAAWANGNTLFWLGRFAEARVCLEANLALADELDLSERMAHFSSDLVVFARAELAWLLWFVGETAAAEAMVDAAVRTAHASATRQDLCIAQCFRALMAWCRRDQATLAAAAESAWLLADAEGLQFWCGVSGMLVVLAQAHAGMPVDFEAVAAGMAAMQSGYRAAATTEAWFVIDALVACGRHADALAMVEQALAAIDLSEHRYCRMELWRLKSVALAALGRAGESAQALDRAVAAGAAAGARGWLQQWGLSP